MYTALNSCPAMEIFPSLPSGYKILQQIQSHELQPTRSKTVKRTQDNSSEVPHTHTSDYFFFGGGFKTKTPQTRNKGTLKILRG